MRILIVMAAAAAAACGGKKDDKAAGGGSGTGTGTGSAVAPKANRWAKVVQPKVSPVCEKARQAFGYGSDCVETPLPELDSPAGKLTRVVAKGDPTNEWLYVLQRADGTMFLGDGGLNGDILDEVTRNLDLATASPELLARLDATLSTEVAVVRCLPGTDDKLPPDGDGKVTACAPPAIATKDGKRVLTYFLERFPHPRLLNRDDHWISRVQLEVGEHELSSIEGRGVVELPRDAPLPPGAPPIPTMTTPPDWVAKPVEAPAAVSDALCAAAVERLSGWEGQRCKAYGYPSLDLPAGKLYYLANDLGERNSLAMQKTDGTIVVGFELEAGENPMKAIVTGYDPAIYPAEKIVALHQFLHGEAVHILCLPGSGDTLPDDECKPPSVEKQGDTLIVHAIVEELPFPDGNGRISDPAVRSFTYELTPGGGMSGGGLRLVDLREGTE